MSLLDNNILEETNIYEIGFPKIEDCILLDTHFSAYCFICDTFAPQPARVISESLFYFEKPENYKPIYVYEWKNQALFKNTMFANGIYIMYKTGTNKLYIILKGFQDRDTFLCDLNKSHWDQACYDDKNDAFSQYIKDSIDISPLQFKKDYAQQLMMEYLSEIKNNFNRFYNKLKCPFKTNDDYHSIDLQIHFTVNDFFNSVIFEKELLSISISKARTL